MSGMALDPESRAALQAVAGRAADLPPQLHARIAGDDLPSMREDAKQLALDAGYAEPPAP
jgi:hypothetical protein